MGLFTGPSLSTALRNYINGTTTVAIQGIPYPASIPGFLAGGSPFGADLMALMANQTATACPNTKLVLAGYSQGAQLVHNAMGLINNATNNTSTVGAFSPAVVNPRITSILLFGDPRNGTAVPGVDNAQRVLSVCHAQDDICAKGGDVVTLDHLTYSQDAAQAAMFAMQRSGLGLASKDAMGQGMGNVPVVKSSGTADGGDAGWEWRWTAWVWVLRESVGLGHRSILVAKVHRLLVVFWARHIIGGMLFLSNLHELWAGWSDSEASTHRLVC